MKEPMKKLSKEEEKRLEEIYQEMLIADKWAEEHPEEYRKEEERIERILSENPVDFSGYRK